MIDVVKLLLRAGDGGDGRVSFRREKYVPKGGPDGGDGGNGGHIIIEGDKHKNTLAHFFGKTVIEAEDGGNGGRRKKRGHTGESTVLKVPLGTQIRVVAENPLSKERRTVYGIDYKRKLGEARRERFELEKEGQQAKSEIPNPIEWVEGAAQASNAFDPNEFVNTKTDELLRHKRDYPVLKTISEHGESFIICQGGYGGRGNDKFKGSQRTTPLIAEFGTPGEQKAVIIELKLLADIGLVGFPNAGKSTLLGVLTKARSKIGAYPFTTLEPHLGIMPLNESGSREAVVADIPGIIAGASEGKGLGFQFLRHVENSRVLQYILFLDEALLYDESVSDEQKAQFLLQQYLDLRQELEQYDPLLLAKPSILTVNKADLYSESLQEKIAKKLATVADIPGPYFFSGVTGEGTQGVAQALDETLRQADSI